MAKTDEKKTTKSSKSAVKEIPQAIFKDKAFEAILQNVNNSEIVRIEALAKGYVSPEKITFGGHNAKSFQPDALAVYESHTDVYAMEAESNKKAIGKNLGKWILFSLEAKKNRGDFYIVTSGSHQEAIQEILDSKQINARILTLDHVLKD